MSPSLHLWPHHTAPGTKLPSSKMHQPNEDHSGRLGGKSTALQQSSNLSMHNGEPSSSSYGDNWHDQKEPSRAQNGTFAGPSSPPMPAAELHRLMLAQLGQVNRNDPRMQSMMPYCAPYSGQGWNPDDIAPHGHMPGALHSGRSNGYDRGMVAGLSNGDMQHMGGYMTHDSTGMYNTMPNGSMHGSTIPPPVTDLRTCALKPPSAVYACTNACLHACPSTSR